MSCKECSNKDNIIAGLEALIEEGDRRILELQRRLSDEPSKTVSHNIGINCWHCNAPLVVKRSGALFHVECTREDIVCGVEGFGPSGLSEESCILSYFEKFKDYIEVKNMAKLSDSIKEQLTLDVLPISSSTQELLDTIKYFENKVKEEVGIPQNKGECHE